MKKLSFLSFVISLLLVVSFNQSSQAQSLYMPRNVKAAFEKGTRSLDGSPGPHYWQNHGNYTIDLTLAPPNRIIKGSEQITYFNDSPDTLKWIVLDLLINHHKPEAIHFFPMKSSFFTSGIHIDHFAINGTSQLWHHRSKFYTLQFIKLPKPLIPRDSVHFSLDWHYEIARYLKREGMIDSTTYFIAYFYPRVAVFDDYSQWDRMPFTGPQQFYNDFNNYTLSVKVPANYIVWATGTLQNPYEVLQPHYAKLLKRSMTSDSVIHIVTPADLEKKNITLQKPSNTWIWKANDVTDVALCVGNHYDWDASSVVVDTNSHRRVSIQAAYEDTALGFHQAVAIGQKALMWLSQRLPGVPYPYPKMTVVLGYAGMEYPMMVNDGSDGTRNMKAIEDEENHEISHTYFPFYMGTNETRYAFMDEGWATTFEYLIGISESGKEYTDKTYKSFRVKWWLNAPVAIQGETQVPIIIPSNIEDGVAYGCNAYGKPSLAYLALKDLLGDRIFKKCLQGYIARWHGKHPIPWDFFNAFNNISSKNLNWFWNSWFFSHGYDDLGVGKVIKTKDGYAVTVKNIGGFVIPFDVKINYSDGSKADIHKTPIVWKENEKQATVAIKTKKKIQSLAIDNGIWMDANERDNGWHY